MTEKRLGYISSLGMEDETLYDVNIILGVVVTTLVVCNRGADTSTFRVAHKKSNEELLDADYIYYDVVIFGNDTFIAQIELFLSLDDSLIIHSGNSNLSYSVYGKEKTS